MLVRGDENIASVDEVQLLTMERNDVLKEVREQLSRAHNRMKRYAYKHRREVSFEVVELVYLKIHSYKLK